MKKVSAVLLMVTLIVVFGVVIGLGVNYFVKHYGYGEYQLMTSLINYDKYRLIRNSTLSGYVKADGLISVYILTKENFEKMKEGKPFDYYRAWKRVKKVEFHNIKIPKGDYILVIKNEEKSMQWISTEIVDKK